MAGSPTGQDKPSGTLLIPAVVVGQVIYSLVGAMQELDKKVRETRQRLPNDYPDWKHEAEVASLIVGIAT